jgi:hypothetical protein
VHCYIGLLSSMSEGDTSLLAEEIICKGDSAVPLLLSTPGDSAENTGRRILGLELLVHFIRAQSSSDVSKLLADHTQQACAPSLPMRFSRVAVYVMCVRSASFTQSLLSII